MQLAKALARSSSFSMIDTVCSISLRKPLGLAMLREILSEEEHPLYPAGGSMPSKRSWHEVSAKAKRIGG